VASRETSMPTLTLGTRSYEVSTSRITRQAVLEIAWQRYPARAQLAPWYDPKGTRVKGG
jgi:hypothetical protein